LLIGNALKKSGQLLTLALRQRRAERFVVFLSDATDVTECHLPFVGQVELISAPIFQAVLPLYKPALFQLVDDRHQAARVHAKRLRQSLLAQPSGSAEYAENACVGRQETQRSKSLREFAGSV